MYTSLNKQSDDEQVESGAEAPLIVLPRPGDVVEGKYRITKLIGEGGMGVVFEAFHLGLGKPVALKFLHPAAVAVPGATARFDREARASAQLRGPNVAHVLDVDATPAGASYMVMELLRGCDLEAELHGRGRLPIAEAVDIVLQVCSAMKEAHALGIVHRDLKPSNVFLARGETAAVRPVVKVLDFGISLIAGPDVARVTSTAVSLGTPLYMSPEQVRCSKRVDSRSDIWSIGVILYETLAGEPPFSGEATAAVAAIVADETPSICDKRPDVPGGLDSVIGRALSKDLRRRYQDVDELADALAPFGTGRIRAPKPVSARVQALARTWLSFPPIFASPSPRVSPRFARRARLVLTLAACVFVLPAITFAGLSHSPSGRVHAVEGATCAEVAGPPARVADQVAPHVAPQHVAAAVAPQPREAAATSMNGAARVRSATTVDVPSRNAPGEPSNPNANAKVDPLYL